MSPVLPLNSVHIDQAKESFVDQRGRLKGVLLALAPHAPLGDSLELGVENRRQLVERAAVARAPGSQQPCDVRGLPGFELYHFEQYSRFIALPPGGGDGDAGLGTEVAGSGTNKLQKFQEPLSCFSVRLG
jgi:hypothetical protein